MSWEKYQKYKTFSVPIEKKKIKIDKDGNESVETISYKIKFINSVRFIATSLSNLVDNLAEGIHKVKCKDCDCFLEYESVRENLIDVNVNLAIKIIQTSLMKNLKIISRTQYSFLTMILKKYFVVRKRSLSL